MQTTRTLPWPPAGLSSISIRFNGKNAHKHFGRRKRLRCSVADSDAYSGGALFSIFLWNPLCIQGPQPPQVVARRAAPL